MSDPWIAERELGPDDARALVEAQFPDLAPVSIERFGAGWDNTAYLVNGAWVFRFPRREIAVPWLATETRLLPWIAPRVPLEVPLPTRVGQPGPRFDWPFAGYRLLRGTTACRARLDDAERLRAAPLLGEFLASLHSLPLVPARQLGADVDGVRRDDVAYRTRQLEERLAELGRAGLVESTRPLERVLEQCAPASRAYEPTLVHADLYARHVIVSTERLPCAIIDWGDVHIGDAALDLSIAHAFLPSEARAAFRAAYGEIDAETWRMARFWALHSAVITLLYGAAIRDAALVAETRLALGHLRQD